MTGVYTNIYKLQKNNANSMLVQRGWHYIVSNIVHPRL